MQQATYPIVKDLVLVGGGHTHALASRSLLLRRSEFFSWQGGGHLFGSNIAENGCSAIAQGIWRAIDVVEPIEPI